MGGKSDPPPAPDYSEIAAASEKSAEYAFTLGKEQLAWAKEQFAQNKEVSDAVIEAALGRQEISDAQAAQDRERYENIFQPLEEQLAYDAENYASEDRKTAAAGRAEADVAQQFEAARKTAQSRLEQFGVDPSQTRSAALDLQTRVAEAAAQASAGNQARTALDDKQIALRSEAINVGRGYPGQIATQYGTAMGSGNAAANTGLATTASGANTMGTGAQWQGMGNQALGTWGSTLNMGYQNQLAGWQAQQSQSSGIGSMLGLAAGFMPGFAEGGAVPEPGTGGMPEPVMAADGVYVPHGLSPSGGAIPDDVPAQLSPGEFVVPEDVTRWYGEKFFQNLITKARKSGDDPKAAPAQGGQPTPATGPPVIRTQAIPG